MEAADGLHDDGWCWPETRLTLSALADAKEFRVGLWFQSELNADRVLVSISTDKTPPSVQMIELGEPKDIVLPLTWRRGEIMSVRIATPHKMTRAAGEQRDIAFSLMHLKAT